MLDPYEEMRWRDKPDATQRINRVPAGLKTGHYKEAAGQTRRYIKKRGIP